MRTFLKYETKCTLKESKWCNDSNITMGSYSTLISSKHHADCWILSLLFHPKVLKLLKTSLPQSRNQVYDTVETRWVAMQTESFRVELNIPSQSNLICRMFALQYWLCHLVIAPSVKKTDMGVSFFLCRELLLGSSNSIKW